MAEKRISIPLNVAGIDYRVTLVDDIRDIDHDDEKVALYGQVSYKTRSIRIFSGQPKDAMYETLLHELIHCIGEAANLQEVLTEESVGIITRLLYDTLDRNGFLSKTGAFHAEFTKRNT